MVEIIRASVRPIVTVGVVAAYCIACLQSDDAVSPLKDLVLPVVAWWFAGKQLERNANDNNLPAN